MKAVMSQVKILFAIYVLATATTAWADDAGRTQDSAKDRREPVSLKSVLKEGIARNSLPEDVVIRVGANMWRTKPSSQMKECWEFSSNQVHRIQVQRGQAQPYRRMQSLPFDSRHLCPDLADADLMKIIALEGEGEAKLFAGTDFEFGDRWIEVYHRDQRLIWVGESCVFAGLPETDAVAFAAIYEQLASRARAAFSRK